MFKSIKVRLVSSYLILILLIVSIFVVVISLTIRNYYVNYIDSTIKNSIQNVSNFYQNYLTTNEFEYNASKIIKDYSYLPFQIQVINSNGIIVQDSIERTPGGTLKTPDVIDALSGTQSYYYHQQPQTGETIVSYSVPLIDGQKIVGVLRFSTSMELSRKSIFLIIALAFVSGILIIVFSLLLSLVLSKTITNPILHLTEISQKIATGDLSVRANVFYPDETGKLAESLNNMSEELGKTEKLKYEFISSVSHELRTPLTSIRGWAVTIMNLPPDETIQAKKGMEIIAQESERLSEMVEELLDFSRYYAGRLQLKFQNCNIIELVNNICFQLRPRADKQKVSLMLNANDNDIYANIDPARIKQVIINLMDNSLKHTPEGGTITLSVKLIRNHGETFIRISVADTGKGIKSADLPNIKQRFYKGSYNLNDKGLGLGLAISDQIVNLHGGNMDIDSVEGHGTNVTIKLPWDANNS